MRAVRLMVAIVFAVVWVLVLAAPARAGGPTSVLLVAPGWNAAGLYYSDPEYEKLTALLRVNDSDGAGSTDKDGPRYPEGPFVTVTWMIHDVRVWRVDRIYYEAGDEPWIHTIDNLEPNSAGVWHRSPNPDELVDLLQRLHLTGGGTGPLVPPEFADRQSGTEPSQRIDESSAPAAPAAGPQDPPPPDNAVSGWWWAGGGVLVGMLTVGAAVRLYPIARSARPKRQQLVDF